ncbi:Signal transduction histidine-protein kinase BarA [Pseudobythopirellula maris]|uniref:histidine kinase n=1 Tax=Pseudobythopirellula maris TaxID=2527991 RepID=A0A5C5ZSN0_9BACT|nr:Signal transduction histidine-protein kinase BarA [Pseudobythopirellula maris]
MMSSCRDAIIACSLDGEIRSWNRGAEEIYGYSRQQALGESLSLITPADRTDELQSLAEQAVAGDALEPFDTVRVRQSGQEFPAAIRGFPIRDAEGSVVGFATVERDVSDRVDAADALHNALAAAQEANAAKTRFLANVSHELRTPMNAIVGMTALALEEKLSPELRDYLETIRDSSDAMLHLVNDVLDLSKFDSQQFEFEEVAFDPRDLVEGTIKVLGSAAHAKGLELVCRLSPNTPSAVVGDPVRLRQVLTNLIGNAIKFTPSGEVLVEVTPEALERGRCKLRFRVIDTGIGVSPKDRDKIFAPFTQVDSATTRRYSGTGLGLTIARHLIHCFGGELKVNSKKGEGSCFSFMLSLPLADKRPTLPMQAAERLSGLRVLVADDNESTRGSLLEQLEAWKIEAEAVESGRDALDILREASDQGHPFDVALIDALMPGIDGFSVASRVEGDESIVSRTILMASTTDRLEFSRRCAEAGASGYVQKPISQSQLLNAVAQVTGASTLEGEPTIRLFDEPGPSEPLRVLLVEDTPANRKVVKRALSKRGHELREAVNGREAVDAFRKEDFDVILMDVQMPIMDGLQATEAIREIEHRSGDERGVPIIALTAHSMRGDRERCLRAGMSGYLSKPLDLRRLIHSVEESAKNGDKKTRELSDLHDTKDKGMTTEIEATSNDRFDEQLWDPEKALSRLRGDRSLLMDMIKFYEEDHLTLLKTIDAQQQAGELDDLQRAAHSLKGLASTFEADRTVGAARDLEHAARDGEADKLEPLVKKLSSEANALAIALTAYREST